MAGWRPKLFLRLFWAKSFNRSRGHRMQFGIWTPLPHTTAPEPRITQAIQDLTTAGQSDGVDRSLQFAIDMVRKAEAHGFITTLIAARHLGPDLEAWTLATALAMQTSTIEIMVAAHPGIIPAQMVAKMGASLDRISGGRLALNVVNGWNVEEFDTFGNGAWQLTEPDRYQRMDEFIQVVKGLWTEETFSFAGRFYKVSDSNLPLKTVRQPNPPIYAASRNPEGKRTIAKYADTWFAPDLRDFRRYDETLALVRREIADLSQTAAGFGRKLGFGMSAHVVCAGTMEEAVARAVRLEAYGDLARYNKSAVSGLGACLVGTPQLIAERICAYEQAGLDFILIQSNPMEEGLDQFLSDILPLVNASKAKPKP